MPGGLRLMKQQVSDRALILGTYTGARGVLVRTDHCGVDRHRPVTTLVQVGVTAQLIEDLDPGAIT
jgi:hypothetical protein